MRNRGQRASKRRFPEIADYIHCSGDLRWDAVADVPSGKSNQSPMERRPIRIGRCRKAFLNAGSAGLLAGLLAGLGLGGQKRRQNCYGDLSSPSPLHAAVLSRFIPPIYHLASLGWLRQSSSRLVPAMCVRLQGPRSIRSCYCASRWCLPRAKPRRDKSLQ